MKRTNIILSDEQHKKLTLHAKKNRSTLGELVRKAVDISYMKTDALRERREVAVKAYAEGFISLGKLSEVLGIDPISARTYLKEQGISLNVQDMKEISRDFANA